jgi:hypothetical protein
MRIHPCVLVATAFAASLACKAKSHGGTLQPTTQVGSPQLVASSQGRVTQLSTDDQGDLFWLSVASETATPNYVEAVGGTGTPTIIESDFGLNQVASDGTNIYSAAGNAVGTVILRKPVVGGTQSTFASEMGNPTLGSMVLTEDSIYWTANHVLYQAAKSGGTVATLDMQAGRKLFTDGTSLYGVDTVDVTTITKEPISGGTPETVTGPNGAKTVGFDSSAVYIAVAGPNLVRIPLSGGSATTLFTGDPLSQAHINAIVSDGSTVYWSYTGVLQDGFADPFYQIWAIPVAGGKARQWLDADGEVLEMTIDDQYLYWSQDGFGGQDVYKATY